MKYFILMLLSTMGLMQEGKANTKNSFIAEKSAKKVEVVLYYAPYCSYCKKVLAHLEKMDIKIPLKNVQTDSSAREYLKINGGKTQIPCLFIDGKALYESNDIIKWLTDNKKKIKNS